MYSTHTCDDHSSFVQFQRTSALQEPLVLAALELLQGGQGRHIIAHTPDDLAGAPQQGPGELLEQGPRELLEQGPRELLEQGPGEELPRQEPGEPPGQEPGEELPRQEPGELQRWGLECQSFKISTGQKL